MKARSLLAKKKYRFLKVDLQVVLFYLPMQIPYFYNRLLEAVVKPYQ